MVTGMEAHVDTMASALWGIGRTLRKEYPNNSIVLIDADPDDETDDIWRLLARELRTEKVVNEDIAYRQCVRYVARLKVRKNLIVSDNRLSQCKIHEKGAYVITGGTSGIGLKTTEWIANQGAKHIALIGRRLPSSEALEVISRLNSKGVKVVLVQGDVGNIAEVTRFMGEIEVELSGVAGLFHSAGVVDDGMFLEQTLERFDRVMHAKALGAFHLHEWTRDIVLDFFAMFSSTTSVFGNVGQSNYGAANAILDVVAAYRKSNGLCGLSINWGPWTIGMVSFLSSEQHSRLYRDGVYPITPEIGLEALERALETDLAQLIVCDIDWKRFDNDDAIPLLEHVCNRKEDEIAKAEDVAVSKGIELRTELIKVQVEAREDLLKRAIMGILRNHIGADIDDDIPLMELGIDSLMAVEIRNAFQSALGHKLPVSFLFTYPTVQKIVDFHINHFKTNFQIQFGERAKIKSGVSVPKWRTILEEAKKIKGQ